MNKSLVIALLISTPTLMAFASEVNLTQTPVYNWLDKCSRCHGDNGKANTILGRKLTVPDYSSKKEQNAFTNENARKILSEGVNREGKQVMPAFKDELNEDERDALLVYVRALAKNP